MEESSTWQRLDSQITWCDHAASSNQIWFKVLKVAQIAIAAGIPAGAAAGAGVAVGGVMGAVVVVLEGVQQLFQFQSNWTSYRSTCESLKREQALFLAHAGVYARDDREQVLALRVESLVADETTKWAASQQELARNNDQK